MSGNAANTKDSSDNAWDLFLSAGLILWICRVSVISVIAGLLLFGLSDQARDTFLEIRGSLSTDPSNVILWAIFFALVVIVWALPVHFAARRDLELDPIFRPEQWAVLSERQRCWRNWLAMWVPRALAVTCLLSIALGAYLARPPLVETPKANDLYALAVEQSHNQANSLAVTAVLLAIALLAFLIARKKVFQRVPHRFGTAFLALLFMIFIALFFIPLGTLEDLTSSSLEGLTRATLIPLLLGGWIPLLAWLANKGRIYHAPFIVLLVVGLELLTFTGDNQGIRAEPISSQGKFDRKATGQYNLGVSRNTLQEKIAEWKCLMHCGAGVLATSNPTECNKATERSSVEMSSTNGHCPRPIIVAASGGASRAGFYTAAILGELIDLTRDRPGYHDFQDQLFAISSVSGSSTGAAFFAAALHDQTPDNGGKRGRSPCDENAKSALFFSDQPPGNWRDCMELLLSGDFLSATIFTYFYKDSLGGLARILGLSDRAVALEEAWQRQYRRFVSHKAGGGAASGLELPFLNVAGFRDEARCSPWWRPLLFFNSTDVDTGRRVIVSSVTLRTKSPRGKLDPLVVSLHPDAYDLHLLLADRPEEEGRRVDPQNVNFVEFLGVKSSPIVQDIRLSTAAALSARFPFITPPGIVLNRKLQLVGRLVDGGYYENFGAATALDIAKQLKAAGLDPFLLEITNDPEIVGPVTIPANGTSCQFDPGDPVCEEPPVVRATDEHLFSDIRGPLRAFFGSRSAQGAHSLWELANFAGAEKSGCLMDGDHDHPSFKHIFLAPQYVYSPQTQTCTKANVPMSWWLSKPVQAYIAKEIPKLQEIATLMKIDDSEKANPPTAACEGPAKHTR